MQIKRLFKILRITLLYPLLAIIVMVGLFYGYLMFGPHSFPRLSHLMEKYVEHTYPGIHLHVNDMKIGIDRKTKLISIWFNDVGLQVGDKLDPIDLKKLHLKLNPIGLLPGNYINLINFEFSFDSLPTFAPPIKVADGKVMGFQELYQWVKNNQKLLDRFCYILDNSIFDLKLPNGKIAVFDIVKIQFRPIVQDAKTVYHSDIVATINDYRFDSFLILGLLDNGNLGIDGTIKNLDSKMLEGLGIMEELSKDIDLKINGKFNAEVNYNYEVQKADFALEGKDGIIKKSTHWPEELPIKQLQLLGDVVGNFKTININKLQFVSNDKTITGRMQYENEVLYADLTLNPLTLKNTLNSWPKNIGTSLREWIVKHIKEIETDKINVALKIDINDMIRGAPMLKDGALIKIPVRKAKIVFPENAPAIEDIEGLITAYGDSVDVKIYKAKMQNSSLSDFNLHIRDIPFAHTDLFLKGNIQGPIQEAIDMAFIQAEKKNEDLKNFSGDAVTSLNLIIPISDHVTVDDLKISAEAKLSNVAVQKLLGKYTISKGNFDVKVVDGLLQIKGTAMYANFIPIIINREQHLFVEKKPPFVSHTTIEANISRKQLADSGYSIPDEISGNTFTVRVKVDEEKEGVVRSQTAADLKKNAINLPTLGNIKAVGEPGELTFKILSEGEEQTKGQYQLKTPHMKSEGEVVFTKDNDVISINSEKTYINDNPFGFTFKKGATANYFLIKGDVLDLSKSDLADNFNSKNTKRDRPIIIESKVKKVILKNRVALINPSISAKCSTTQCNTFSLNGNLASGGSINVAMNYPHISITSSNAGELISAIDVSKNISQGNFKLDAQYVSADNLQGEMYIHKFQVKKAPLFAKLFSLASMTTASGLFSLLQNKGVFFDEMHCTFGVQNSMLDVKRCLQKGPVMEIDVNGKADLNRKQMHFQGVYTPANIFNSAADSIPIIGDLLTGGKDSHLISINFTVKGSFDNPSISGNPLSAVTPGLLRKLFSSNKPIESVD